MLVYTFCLELLFPMPALSSQSCSLLHVYHVDRRTKAITFSRPTPLFRSSFSLPYSPSKTKESALTNSHTHKKPCHESSEIDNRVPRVFVVIWVGASSTYPVRQRCDNVGSDDQEGQVLVEERAREDYEENA